MIGKNISRDLRKQREYGMRNEMCTSYPCAICVGYSDSGSGRTSFRRDDVANRRKKGKVGAAVSDEEEQREHRDDESG